MYGRCPGCESRKRKIEEAMKADDEKRKNCKHKNLVYAGTDTDSEGNKCNIMVCKDCDEAFMQIRPHP